MAHNAVGAADRAAEGVAMSESRKARVTATYLALPSPASRR
jgi:hypothetical protein